MIRYRPRQCASRPSFLTQPMLQMELLSSWRFSAGSSDQAKFDPINLSSHFGRNSYHLGFRSFTHNIIPTRHVQDYLYTYRRSPGFGWSGGLSQISLRISPKNSDSVMHCQNWASSQNSLTPTSSSCRTLARQSLNSKPRSKNFRSVAHGYQSLSGPLLMMKNFMKMPRTVY